ncbi:MAG: alpha-glucosidase [Treponema sp.]|nr:alpha-glucosidase [Treponema sp.]
MRHWWQDAVFYQIYPRSFADANGDGIGDLRGILGRLDYLRDLGVDALWISPFFPSPQKDWGYDVADYRGVDPDYGSLDDFRELVGAAHERGIRLILDLVVNHSSDEHPWFRAARASKEAVEHDYYLWKPLSGKKPNNWVCLFEQASAWFPNAATGERYLGTFTRFQPEFDWRNPRLREEIYAVMRYWLDLGADGFRLDVATAYIKDAEFRSNPFSPRPIPDLFQKHLYDRNRPEVHEIFREMRQVVGDDRVLVGETHGVDVDLAASCYGPGDELHLAFNFDFLETKWSASAFRAAAERWYSALPDGAWPVFTLSNHDRPRHAWRYRGRTPAETEGRAKVAATLLLMLRGSPFLYFGEELAMTSRRIPRSRLRDPLGVKTWPLGFLGRDPERTPMQWTAGPSAGFSQGAEGREPVEPWLPLNPDWPGRNVEVQLRDSLSTLSHYRGLIALRRAHAALREGDMRFVDTGKGADLLCFERRVQGESLLVALNFASESRDFRLDRAGVQLFGGEGRQGTLVPGTLRLAPLESLIIALT